MYLQKLETVGFKSFADKIGIDFLPPSGKSKGITAIVGPNGSGKSNVADALRWVLGEQSAKTLRGKKADDVIFSGSEKRSRSGLAEATIVLNNEDGKIDIEAAEIAITRRVYRDGDSEYLINKNKVRLTDIQLLLAQAQFGARTYAVIGQGMADAILVASPQERKEFFDEAAGVRQYQLKRQQSVNKMDAARENLAQAEMLMNEIEPRLRSLSRQVKRLQERDGLEEELHAICHEYYGRIWRELKAKIEGRQQAVDRLSNEWKSKESTLKEAQEELARLAKQETQSDEFTALQQDYQKLVDEKNRLRMTEMEAKSQLEIATQVQKKTAGALPMSKIIERVGGIGGAQTKAIGKLKSAADLNAAKATADDFESVLEDAQELRQRLENPVPEKSESKDPDPKLVKALADAKNALANHDGKVSAALAKLQQYNQVEQSKKAKFFELQRGLQDKISAAHALERRLNEEKVEMARLDTRREALEQEMSQELGENVERVKQTAEVGEKSDRPTEELQSRIQKLKYQLNLIGGIDPEAVKEYEDTKSRYDYLEGQVTDLHGAIADLDKVIEELDVTIKSRSETAFRNINREFGRYFQTLFGGGKAELVQLRHEEKPADPEAEGEEAAEPAKPSKYRHGEIIGVEISACPPGKKIKNISMLSGGERALTSIALICAILHNNPSPFVVLDEVDAALDESNADRFAAIIEELAHKTQFILITHNRYTMKRANVLYGVTMGDDGTSKLLSVNLDQVGGLKNAAKSPQKMKV
jgi:chromosome segregation ATPase